MPQINLTDKEDVVVVTFNQAQILDEGTIRQIGSEFLNLTTQAAAERKLLLNFSGVTFMSSAMLGQIMKLSKQAKQDKIDLKLSDISPNIMEVFKILNLTKVLSIYKTEAEALKAFGPPRKRFRRRIGGSRNSAEALKAFGPPRKSWFGR
ncbi:MAG: STAS domain-containing protein [Planctomycetes bacterium]|nr:STAS domain-containing protein [Planctomycetota bacterium]